MAGIGEALALALTHHQAGRLPEAEILYRRILEIDPRNADALYLLGAMAAQLGQSETAVTQIRRAVELRPDAPDWHETLGNSLLDLGRMAEAADAFRTVVGLNPVHFEAWNHLGIALARIGKPEDAVASFRRALELRPDFAEVHHNLGLVLRDGERLTDAIACFRRALELKPDTAEILNNLGTALRLQGQPNEATACYRRAVALQPDYPEYRHNLLLSLHYCPDMTPALIRAAHDEYGYRQPVVASPPEKPRSARLRLGFISPDLGHHPVGRFLVRPLENIDRDLVDVVCYSDRTARDATHDRLRAASGDWHDTGGWSEERLAKQIRADRIDILFDLAGHTANTRLRVFANRPAFMQITWIGYEGTTGLPAMDYLIADGHMIPPGQEHHYRERVLRMPDGYLCFDPPAEAPPVNALPLTKKGHVTFGCFNNLAKISPTVVALWSQVLSKLPDSRLILQYRGLADAGVRQRFQDLFAAQDVDPRRLDLRPARPFAEYLAGHHDVDLALDPFPFSGSATTCDALWMGVPVVTWPRETFASRHTLSHLAALGLTELAAATADDFVAKAVALATDPTRLRELRATLRDRMASSTLCDGRRFAGQWIQLLRGL